MVKNVYELFNENSIVFVLFLIVLLVIFKCEKNNNIRALLVYPSIIILLCVFNPVILMYATKYMVDVRVVRLYWLFPITILLAYCIVKIVERFDKRTFQRSFSVCILTIIILVTGKYMFLEQNFEDAPNMYKLPDDAIVICEAIAEDGYEGVLVPSMSMVETIRQYDANVVLAYGRNVRGDYGGIAKSMNSSVLDMQDINAFFEQEGYRYLIIDKRKDVQGEAEEFGFKLMLETEEHYLYKYDSAKNY